MNDMRLDVACRRPEAAVQTCVSIGGDCSSQTNPRRASPGGADRQVCHIHDSPEQLGLGNSRVSHHQAVDVSSQMVPICQVALSASQQQKNEALLDEIMAVDGGG